MNGYKILITGGAGFIGQALLMNLVNEGQHEVTVLDNFNNQIHGSEEHIAESNKLLSSFCNVVRGDVRDRELIDDLLLKNEVVFHLAAETGTGQSMYEIGRYCDVNVSGTANILESAARPESQVVKIVLASSRSVYGEGKYRCRSHQDVYPGARNAEYMTQGNFEVCCPICGVDVMLQPTDELSFLSPQSVYAVTKLTQERLVMTAGPAIGTSVCALRFQNVYGPGQSLINPYTGILSIFSTAILQGETINIFEDGLESRDFVYVDDVVAAMKSALATENAANHVINIGSGVPTSVNTVASELFRAFDKAPVMEVSGQYRVGDIRHNYADISKAKQILAFQPSVSFADGITKFTDWVKTQNMEKSLYKNSLDELGKRGLFK